MGYSNLEDYFGDIVGKAMVGRGVSSHALAEQSGLSVFDIGRVTSYDLIPDEAMIHKIADTLGLDGKKLTRVANGWVPEGGNDRFQSERVNVDRVILSAGMEVNAYVMKCLETGEGALIDAGGQPDRISALIEQTGARITHILLTHGHADHVGATAEMKSRTGAKVCCSEVDAQMFGGPVDVRVDDGWADRIGSLEVNALSLPGHTAGGIAYATEGVCFPGDALFAASLGGARREAYTGQIEAVRQKVMSLPSDTKVFPGHGPITTVRQENDNNPVIG